MPFLSFCLCVEGSRYETYKTASASWHNMLRSPSRSLNCSAKERHLETPRVSRLQAVDCDVAGCNDGNQRHAVSFRTKTNCRPPGQRKARRSRVRCTCVTPLSHVLKSIAFAGNPFWTDAERSLNVRVVNFFWYCCTVLSLIVSPGWDHSAHTAQSSPAAV